jgi:hypothetical protein
MESLLYENPSAMSYRSVVNLLVYADREKSIDGLARVLVCNNRERVYSVIIVNE